jgi:hypothetical protein
MGGRTEWSPHKNFFSLHKELSKNINGPTDFVSFLFLRRVIYIFRLYQRLHNSLVEPMAKGESGEIRKKAVKVQWRYYEGIFQRTDWLKPRNILVNMAPRLKKNMEYMSRSLALRKIVWSPTFRLRFHGNDQCDTLECTLSWKSGSLYETLHRKMFISPQ